MIEKGGKYGINWAESTSPRGLPLDEVRSAVIKEIRHNRPEDAVYWALEMLDTDEEQVIAALWDDLRVCALEDIGLADPDALIIVSASKDLYTSLHKEDARRKLALAHAVLYLCRASKTRYGNELLGDILNQRRKNLMTPSIPDRAVDMHTKRGKEMGCGLAHYLTHAASLDPTTEDNSFPTKHRARLLS